MRLTQISWMPFTLVSLLILTAACTEKTSTNPTTSSFASIPTTVPVQPGLVDEASGLADSRTIDGHLWVEEDSGNPAQLNLLAHDGRLVGRLPLPGVQNRDWEDMAIGPGPQAGISYLYVADIGDNAGGNAENYIYRLTEPTSLTAAIPSVDRIAFRYADGPRDAETLLLDPQTREVWIVTKNEARVRLYRLPYPQDTRSVMTATFEGELPLSLVTSGSISADGQEILLKTYTGLYYWPRSKSETIAQALTKAAPKELIYKLEPQGEGVCFDKMGTGFLRSVSGATLPR